DTSDLSFSKADTALLAARYTRMIEDEIRRRPEEWFWLHNRWKRTVVDPNFQTVD
ncbi:MAG: lipid A biosynthesis acyltransferase, partial [Chlorobium sp.]|uniref:LpxL/LpxP family acyltransferase n=1 Tax=Chlorobium sp. TaxID=1095 RepID=UPI002F579914